MRIPFKLPALPRFKLNRKASYLAVEVVGALAVLVGVSAWSWPSACILGGLVTIFAIERQE